MSEIKQFIQNISAEVLEIAQQTVDHFGAEKADHFMRIAGDGLKIKLEIMSGYTQQEQTNLINHQAWGLVKELKWLEFLFLAGNYPLVKNRLRYIWEAVFRAYFVEGTMTRPSVIWDWGRRCDGSRSRIRGWVGQTASRKYWSKSFR